MYDLIENIADNFEIDNSKTILFCSPCKCKIYSKYNPDAIKRRCDELTRGDYIHVFGLDLSNIRNLFPESFWKRFHVEEKSFVEEHCFISKHNETNYNETLSTMSGILRDAGCIALGTDIYVNALGWDDQKIEYLISENIYRIDIECKNFQEIERCYNDNPDKTRYIINRLIEEDCLKLAKYLNTNVLDWKKQKIDDLFSNKVLKNNFFIEFIEIEELYEKNAKKTCIIINRLCDESCPVLGVYVNQNVFNWDYQKMKDLFSNNIWKIVKNGCEFATIRKCYDKNPDKTLAIINQICKSGFPEFGKNIYVYVLDWHDQKTKALFLDNVWKIVRKCKNFNEIEKCYDSDPEKTLKIINRICNLGYPELGKYINFNVLGWKDQDIECLLSANVLGWNVEKIEYLFSKNVWQAIKNGGSLQKIAICYDKYPHKTRNIIIRLKCEGCLEFAKYLDINVLDWDLQKTNYLFSRIIWQAVERGADFHEIELRYDIDML